MVFGNKNRGKQPAGGQHVLRGRDSVDHGQGADNPLARRVHADDEPDTVDLREPGRFHAAVESDEPPTSSYGGLPEGRQELIGRDDKTGKFYVYPGSTDRQVLLAGEPVLTQTELRRGDIIQVGNAKFQFLA